MLYLCDGQPKSGSTFLFQLIQRLVDVSVSAPELQATASEPPFLQAPHMDEASGFIQAPAVFEQQLASNEDWRHQLRTRTGVFKLHWGRWIAPDDETVDVVHFFTFRNVLDAALALYEQSMRELAKPSERQREAFTRLSDPDLALQAALGQFSHLSRAALEDERIHCLPCPAFITGESVAVSLLSRAVNLAPDRVVEEIEALDGAIRAGRVFAEFGTGEHGRGRTRTDLFSIDLVRSAEELNEQWGL